MAQKWKRWQELSGICRILFGSAVVLLEQFRKDICWRWFDVMWAGELITVGELSACVESPSLDNHQHSLLPCTDVSVEQKLPCLSSDLVVLSLLEFDPWQFCIGHTNKDKQRLWRQLLPRKEWLRSVPPIIIAQFLGLQLSRWQTNFTQFRRNRITVR